MKSIFLLSFIFLSFSSISQNDSIFIRTIYSEALSYGKSYFDLRSLCKDIGARITGSAEAEMAILWGKQKMEEYGFDKVYLQEIEVPHWERGTKEAGWIKVTCPVLPTSSIALLASLIAAIPGIPVFAAAM